MLHWHHELRDPGTKETHLVVCGSAPKSLVDRCTDGQSHGGFTRECCVGPTCQLVGATLDKVLRLYQSSQRWRKTLN